MGNLLSKIFGQWQAPPWMLWFKRHPSKGAACIAGLALVAALSWTAWDWYQHLPQPQTVKLSLIEPELTNYESEEPQIAPLVIRFEESVAPLDLIGKPIEKGARLKPAIAGQWWWASDKHLQFKPEADWPADQTYTISLDIDDLFSHDILLDKTRIEFKTLPFSADIPKAELYQDPAQHNIQKLVATLHFSHPADQQSVRAAVSLLLSPGLSYRENRDYDLSFDAKGVNAYLHSAPLATPLEPSSVTLELGKGLKAKSGGNAAEPTKVRVPVQGLYQLSFNAGKINFAFNDKEQPESVFVFESSNPVSDQALDGKVEAWLLPWENPQGDDYWQLEQVTDKVLQSAERVALVQNPGADNANTLHSFKFSAPVGRYMMVKIAKNIEGLGGYLSRDDSFFLVRMPSYPRALSFLGEGALLSLNGEQRLGYMSRGVDEVRIEVAQLLPDQIHQLVDENSGILTAQRFDNSAFDRIVTRNEIIQQADNSDPTVTSYGQIDLQPYLKNRRGIFVLKLSPAEEDNRTTFDYYTQEAHDLRLVVLTDLGILAKRNLDSSVNIFVQSLAEGSPVANARVSVVGRNGLAVATAMTDDHGRAQFAALDQLIREKRPLFYRVEKDGDLSFLPIGDWRRELDMSRFDVGGSYESRDPASLNAYLFTERGLYRPGETVHLASLVRSQNWQTDFNGLPVKMQIVDPRGIKVFDHTFNLDRSGFNSVDFKTSETAAAGDYSASLSLITGRNRFTRLGDVEFKVRDFEPDRIKARVSLNGGKDARTLGWFKPSDISAQLQAEQLFGGPAGERRVTTEIVLSPTNIGFSAWPDYRFGVQGSLKDAWQETLAEAKTDASGMAKLELDLNRFENSTFKLHLLSTVYETGSGKGVSAQAQGLVSSAETLLGFKADGDLNFIRRGSERHLKLVAIGQDLAAKDTNLKLERIERRWVSVLVKQRDGTYRYESRRKDALLSTQELTLKGQTDFGLDTTQAGDYRLRLLDEQGRELNQIDYSIAGQGNASRTLERDAELQVTLDKSQYRSGETVNLSIQAPYAGAGLITIERDRVYAFKWFKASSSRFTQTITLPESIEGNAYINVQFMRSASSDEIFMSPLSYAVAPLSIDLGERKQTPELLLPETQLPGQQLPITLSLPKAAKVLVFGVDEGILQTARYRAPDPLGFFFTKKALTVKSSQILDLLLPELRVLMRNAAPGGGADETAALLAANLNPFKRQRADAVVYWSGLNQLEAGEHQFYYRVPDSFNGKIHFFAVSVADNSMGVAEAGVQVKAPVVMSPNVPAFMSPGDEAVISLGLYNTEPNPVKVRVELALDGGLTEVNGAAQSFDILPSQEVTARFNLKALETLGEAQLRWNLSVDGLADGTLAELKMAESISIRPLTPHRAQLKLGTMDEAEKTVALERQLFKPHSRLEAGLQNSPLIWAQGLSRYLESYPHVCTEQLVSKAVPALFLGKDASQVQDNAAFEQLIAQLRSRQNGDGAFGTWNASVAVEPMVTLYVADMLLDAQGADYPVPQDMLNNANGYLSNLSSSPNNGLNELRQRAYASYLLARQGVGVGAALADIRDRLQHYYPKEWQSDIASAWLAASFTLMQQQELAEPIWPQQGWALLDKKWQEKKGQTFDIYSDPLTHDAQLMTLLARHQPHRLLDLPDDLFVKMGAWVSSQRYNSLSAATLVRSLAAYEVQFVSGNLSLSAKLKDNWLGQTLPRANLPYGTEAIRLQNSERSKAFYSLIEEGFDKQVGKAFSHGLEVNREYLDLKGDPLKTVTAGQEFFVRLRLRATELDKLENIVLIDMLPGGVEPVYRDSTRGEGGQLPIGVSGRSDWAPEWANVREDRVVLYGMASRDAKSFTYKVRATGVGRFQAPPAYAEGIYDPQQQAQGASGELVIQAP